MQTKDGKLTSGILVEDQADRLVLKDALGKATTIRKQEIEERTKELVELARRSLDDVAGLDFDRRPIVWGIEENDFAPRLQHAASAGVLASLFASTAGLLEAVRFFSWLFSHISTGYLYTSWSRRQRAGNEMVFCAIRVMGPRVSAAMGIRSKAIRRYSRVTCNRLCSSPRSHGSVV